MGDAERPYPYSSKKKRGNNYTPTERKTLLALVKKRLDIIENKETTSAFIIRKRKAWEEIAQRYNTHASSGPRTFYQLRHLYENLKQRSKKKSSLALENVFCVLGDMDTNDESNFTPPSPEGHGNYDFDIEIQCDQRDDEPNAPLENGNQQPAQQPRKTEPTKRRGASAFKESYFRTKLHNAYLERKFMTHRHRMDMEKHKMELEILNLKLKQMQGQTETTQSASESDVPENTEKVQNKEFVVHKHE